MGKQKLLTSAILIFFVGIISGYFIQKHKIYIYQKIYEPIMAMFNRDANGSEISGGGKMLKNSVIAKRLDYTCTGLAFCEERKEWIVGDIGTTEPSNEFDSKIHRYSEDFNEEKGCINLKTIFPSMGTVQGLAPEDSASIWFCSMEENMVRKIGYDGQSKDSIYIFQPTGIAIDRETGCKYILTLNFIVKLDKNNVLQKIETMNKKAQDQLAIHDGFLWMTSGDDYNSPQFLHKIDTNTLKVVSNYILENSYAVEGVVAKDGLFYVANDGQYHKAKDPHNLILKYVINED